MLAGKHVVEIPRRQIAAFDNCFRSPAGGWYGNDRLKVGRMARQRSPDAEVGTFERKKTDRMLPLQQDANLRMRARRTRKLREPGGEIRARQARLPLLNNFPRRPQLHRQLAKVVELDTGFARSAG